MLAAKHRNLCVVGDDDQSIYGWRGADIRNILEFEKDFPGAKTIRLEQNYRSTEVILNAANLVISNNRGRKAKKLWTDRTNGEPIHLIEAPDDRMEAMCICSSISSGVLQNGRAYDDYAVLYRTHAQSRVLEMCLKSYNIPYRVYGGISFFQRAEVKDLLSYFRLLCNPDDDVAFRRVINTPRRGIGDSAVAELESDAVKNGDSLLSAALRLKDGTGRNASKYGRFCDVLLEATSRRGTDSLYEIMRNIIENIHYDEYLREDKKESYEIRAEIVQELLNYLAEFEGSLTDRNEDPLESFLENVALFASTDQLAEQSGQVALMTLHSAKGLEFPVVFVCGLEQGLFPSSQSTFDPEKLEEERRLCYVGITRAKDALYLSYARQRMNYGTVSQSVPSVFLEELREALPDWEDVRQKKDPPRYSFRSEPDSTGNMPSDSAACYARPGDMHGLGTSKKTPSPTPQEDSGKKPSYSFSAGMRIRHKIFGNGTVLRVEGSGLGQTLEIDFDNGKLKQLAAAYAPVVPLEDKT